MRDYRQQSAADSRPSSAGGPVPVLHVVDCLNVGGTERQFFELLRRLDRRRWQPLVACLNYGGELTPRLLDMGIDPIEFPLKGSLARANTAVQIGRMALLCRRHRVRIIHAHDFYSNLLGVSAARLARIPSIASRRDLAHFLTRSQRRALMLTCLLADRVLVNATAVGDLVAQEFGGAVPRTLTSLGRARPWYPRVEIVHNGIELAVFDAEALREPVAPLPARIAGVPRVAVVASMNLPDKGHSDLLRAASLLQARGHRLQWLLVSDGKLRRGLEEQARALGLGDCFHFLGRRPDVPSILARVDLLVHPSWAEAFPNAVLEALGAGLPVVATRVGGCSELVVDGATGRLVPPRQPEMLASAIEDVLANAAASAEMGRHGRQLVERHFSLERMNARVERIYQSLLGLEANHPEPPSQSVPPCGS